MPSDGVLQVSSISPLQAGDISAVTLHPRLGIPLSLHTHNLDKTTAKHACTARSLLTRRSDPFPQTSSCI